MILTILGLILLIPGEALAWGPATHIHLGSEILKSLSLLSPAVQELLSKYPTDYLYGCIGADIIFGKKFTPYSSHCHNWDVGMKVLTEAGDERQKSFAYGYLSHLAHDMVAHNYYVPVQLVMSFQTQTLRHGYWETRFDIFAEQDVWDALKDLAKMDHGANDVLLEKVLQDNILPFRINKQIFATWLLLHRVRHWKKMVDVISSASRWPLTNVEAEEYRTLALDITVELLNQGEKANCLRGDPTGKRNIVMAKEIRKRLRGLERGSSLDTKTYKEIISIVQPRFRQAIFSSEAEPCPLVGIRPI